ncbi:MAG: C39 family peptidase [Candidatus Komeilibacteria bacterium]|nr:C39 family peptidase [Candidatus Komeilibacteria bacterium]
MLKKLLPKLNLLYTGLALVLLIGLGIFAFKIVILKNLPAAVMLRVPFTTQAPTDNWSRNEDCEETSLVMANAFLSGIVEDKVPTGIAQETINNLKKWEQTNLGYNANTGAEATGKMAMGALGLKITQIQNFTETDLKMELNNKHPILLPINAKLLGSPQYLNNGPTYHMIVIKGYRGDTFIVNDPGTDSGNGNEYAFAILKKASADWVNATKQMDLNRKMALIVSK